MISRDEIVLEYLDHLQFEPYPVQEEALYAWASCQGGVLLSAPTGTGKTLVAEAAIYEALRTDRVMYYSTPLIALTDQKLLEFQDRVASWGYGRDRVGLVTGNRTVNPDAQIKVVVAEVLLNRLLHPEAFDFSKVTSVVMDEFHNFNDSQRGIVWELALSLLPKDIRVMLLSATVGSAQDFVNWMSRSLGRNVTLVEGKDRRVPLHFHWVSDEILPDFLEKIAQGDENTRKTPLLVFCFDREVCWSTADVLKGRDLFTEGQRDALFKRLDDFDFKVGSGAKLRTFLTRGIGIHHAGILPRYRRVVETLFVEKLLPVCVCTETLAAGLNLPARSVVLTTLVKGPPDKRRMIDPSSAQQMFGRAGRPQFDTEGHVYVMAHEDDVKLAHWKEKFDSIPEDTKDPGLMTAKKQLLKKKPTRRSNYVYWNPEQFTKVQAAPPTKLASKGNLTWRWLAYLLDADPQVEPIRDVIRRRLMEGGAVNAEIKRLTRMLITLHQMGIVVLDPAPPEAWIKVGDDAAPPPPAAPAAPDDAEEDAGPQTVSDLLGKLKIGDAKVAGSASPKAPQPAAEPPPYDPLTATPTPKLKDLMVFRAVHPLYGVFLMEHFSRTDDQELIQILESLLAMPGSVAKYVRVPKPEQMPPGKLATEVVDPALLTRGLATQEDLYPQADQSDLPPEFRKYPIPLAQKMRMFFESSVDHAGGMFITPVWAAGDLLEYGGNFDGFVHARDLVKQEGIFFKHLLRLILLCQEFAQLTPANTTLEEWQQRLRAISEPLEESCRAVDPQCTDETLEEMAESP